MSYRINDSKLGDFTAAVNKIPRAWSLLDSLGLAQTTGITSETASVDLVTEKTGLMGDQRRGGARNFVGSESVVTKALSVPFFPLDAAIRAEDLRDLRTWGTENESQTIDAAVDRTMLRIRRYQSTLREKALMESIKGLAYAPNGTTTAYNYYTEFGQTAVTQVFDLANAATDPLALTENVWGQIIDKADDGASSYDVIALCSRGFFTKLIANAAAQDAYTYYQSLNAAQEIRRDRMKGGSISREFVYGNVKYIEHPGSVGGVPFIPVDEAYFLPLGIENMFEVYHAPSSKIADLGSVGQEVYMWIEPDAKGRYVEVESETALLAVNLRPELVVKATAAASF